MRFNRRCKKKNKKQKTKKNKKQKKKTMLGPRGTPLMHLSVNKFLGKSEAGLERNWNIIFLFNGVESAIIFANCSHFVTIMETVTCLPYVYLLHH